MDPEPDNIWAAEPNVDPNVYLDIPGILDREVLVVQPSAKRARTAKRKRDEPIHLSKEVCDKWKIHLV